MTPPTEKKYFIDRFSPFPYKIIWQINNSCNFACEYCFSKDQFGPVTTPAYTNEQIVESFDRTGINWLIVITGGEPFLVPGFIDLLKKLSVHHTITFSSNLSNDDIYKLNEIPDLSKLLLVNASLHYEYRLKQKGGMDDFLKKVLFLQDSGIEVLVSHVAYPPTMKNIPKLFAMLQEKGVKIVSALTFRSKYMGLEYPKNYTKEEIAFIGEYSVDITESKIADGQTNFYGHLCEAGKNFFFMESDGKVRRCGSILKYYGNIFQHTFRPASVLRPCTVKDCVDCYLGFLSVKEKKVANIQLWFDKLKRK